jgi:hypothetical protein
MGLASCSFHYLLTTFTYSYFSDIWEYPYNIRIVSLLLLGLAVHDELDEGELDVEKLDSQEEEKEERRKRWKRRKRMEKTQQRKRMEKRIKVE